MTISEINRLIEEYGTDVYRFCCRLTGKKEDADDLYQETMQVSDGNNMKSPDDTLNQQIRKCAKEIEMNKKRRYRKWMTAAAAAVVFLGVSTTALAAYKVLSASTVAQKLEQRLWLPH